MQLYLIHTLYLIWVCMTASVHVSLFLRQHYEIDDCLEDNREDY